LQTSNLILDFEFDQHLESHKHVINIIMGFRDMGCYTIRAELDNLKSQQKKTINTSKITCETITVKIESMSNSRPRTHFTEHLMSVTENPPHEYNKNLKYLSL
jgi:hypothetical protein